MQYFMDESGSVENYDHVKKMSCNEFLAFINNKITDILAKRAALKK